jgi:hypothetical protein
MNRRPSRADEHGVSFESRNGGIDMRIVERIARWAFGLLMILHGFAHLPGVLGSWQIATFEDVSYQPNALLTDANDAVVALLGLVFFLGGAFFVAAGAGLIWQAAWWLQSAFAALATSLAVTALWHQDAVIGLALNGVIAVALLAVLLARRVAADPRIGRRAAA